MVPLSYLLLGASAFFLLIAFILGIVDMKKQQGSRRVDIAEFVFFMFAWMLVAAAAWIGLSPPVRRAVNNVYHGTSEAFENFAGCGCGGA